MDDVMIFFQNRMIGDLVETQVLTFVFGLIFEEKFDDFLSIFLLYWLLLSGSFSFVAFGVLVTVIRTWVFESLNTRIE